jgi:hypothetical protein
MGFEVLLLLASMLSKIALVLTVVYWRRLHLRGSFLSVSQLPYRDAVVFESEFEPDGWLGVLERRREQQPSGY